MNINTGTYFLEKISNIIKFVICWINLESGKG